ncbi:MAG: hypothetical protein E7212_02615 [Clostridium sartagoforme]|nr:hypothetical protein [Clostridium sartagoforme]
MKKIGIIIVTIIMCATMISYSVLAKDNGIDNSKKLIEDINYITENKLDSSVKRVSESKDSIYDIELEEFESKDLIIDYEKSGNLIMIVDKNKKDEVIKKNKERAIKDKEKLNQLSNDKKIKIKEKAEKISKLFNNDNEKLKESIEFIDEYEIMDGTIAFKWARTENGYKYNEDFIMVIMDPLDGKLVVANKMYKSSSPTNNVKINEEKAAEIASSELEFKNNIDTSKIIKIELKIINPNYYWTNPILTSTDSKLAYEVTFSKKSPYKGEASIWINAEDGTNLGGEQTK